MHTGFVFCSSDQTQVLCFNKERTSFLWKDVENTQTLNQAVCLVNTTEANNIGKRIIEKKLAEDFDIVNISRLYKKFF